MMFLVRDWYNVLDYDYGIGGGEEYMMEFLGVCCCCCYYAPSLTLSLIVARFSWGRGGSIRSSN